MKAGNTFKLEIEKIWTDQGQFFINAGEINFSNAHLISCLFHYEKV